MRLLGVLVGLAVAAVSGCRGEPESRGLTGSLIVFNAGSLAYAFRELLAAFSAQHPGVVPEQESSGSLEAARKITELGKIPDVLAVADYTVITKLLMPKYATGYVPFAANAMVLAYRERSARAAEITAGNWWRILLDSGVRWGHSNPALDPNGYRAMMVFQLAERYYREPGLAGRLERALDPRYMRGSEAQLVGLVQAGELDYAWSYRSLAASAGLRWLSLPPDIDLSDPERIASYRAAVVRLPGATLRGDSVEFRGEPIQYALTIPIGAPHPELARAFVEFVRSAAGRAVLERAGLAGVR
jgi:molybdate/tungstate transport system substrate-binding protein